MGLDLDFGGRLALAVKAGTGAVTALWGGLLPLVQLLLVLMILDVLSGLLAGYYKRELSSDISWRGMTKKGMTLIVVATAGVVEFYAADIIGGLPLMAAVAGFFCMHESLSIAENAGRAGLPIPDVLKDALSRLSPQPQPKPPEPEPQE